MSHSNESPARRLKYIDPVSFTPQFEWKKRDAGEAVAEEVVCERVPLESVAQKFGTPTYVYSRAAIDTAYHELHKGLGALPHTLCFAVKSNGNLSILKHLAGMGSGFDIVSGGELDHLQRIGVRGERVVF
jgi:diaminopimelate decarboxylase